MAASQLAPGFLDVARAVADRGLPETAPAQAVLGLVAVLCAVRGHDERAHAFARLASNFRCSECDEVAPFVDCLR